MHKFRDLLGFNLCAFCLLIKVEQYGIMELRAPAIAGAPPKMKLKKRVKTLFYLTENPSAPGVHGFSERELSPLPAVLQWFRQPR